MNSFLIDNKYSYFWSILGLKEQLQFGTAHFLLNPAQSKYRYRKLSWSKWFRWCYSLISNLIHVWLHVEIETPCVFTCRVDGSCGVLFFLIPHKLLADGDVPEVAEFKVNRDGHKSIKHVYLISLWAAQSQTSIMFRRYCSRDQMLVSEEWLIWRDGGQ